MYLTRPDCRVGPVDPMHPSHPADPVGREDR